MVGFNKKILIGLFTRKVNASNHKKYLSLSNEKYKVQFNLHPNGYSQELHCYPFAVQLDKCVGRFNALNDLSN